MKTFLEVLAGTMMLIGFTFAMVGFFLIVYGLVFDELTKFVM